MKVCRVGIIFLLLASIVTGCGYRLAGHTENQGHLFSPTLKYVSIEELGKYESFRKTLVSTLRAYGIKVVSPRRASARLIFSDKEEYQKISAVGDDVKAREYLLRVKASFRVISGGDKFKTLLPEQSVRAEVVYLANPDQPLLTEREKNTVMVGDIEGELCRKIVLRLATIRHK